MEVFDAVRTLLAVRKYADQPIAPDITRRIVEAGYLTGSSMNQQPWHFIVVDDRATLQQLGALASSGGYTAGAAMAVVVCIEAASQFGESDASRAIQSMVLTAWSEGIGSNWVGWYGLNGVKPLLDIPDGLEVLAIVPFGYPADDIGRGRKNRKPFDEIVSHARFGEPLGTAD